MKIIHFSIDELAARPMAATPVPAPVGTPVSEIRSSAFAAAHSPRTRAGYWQSTVGTWRRQVTQAEFCHFLSGTCTFTPDGGEPIEIKAGDVLFFPENSGGIWTIREASAKIFLVFDEASAPSG